MTTIPVTNILIADGEYYPIKARSRGRIVSVEISGVFGGATVAPGYTSADTVPVFVADGTSKTAIGRWNILVPNSGRVALKVTSASGTTAIKVKITDSVQV